MLKKPNNYDEIIINEDYEKIELGGHKGIILEVEEYKNEITGNESLKVRIDFDKDDKQAGYFQKQYDNNKLSEAKWHTAGIKYVSLKDDETCVKMLKAFITAVENSNQGFIYDWNKEVNQLNNKRVGLVYGLEEYLDNENKTKVSSKIRNFRSIDKVLNIEIPKVKLISGDYVSVDDYEEFYRDKGGNKNTGNVNKVEITDEMLPF